MDLVCADANDANRVVRKPVKTMLRIVHLIIRTLLCLRYASNGEAEILKKSADLFQHSIFLVSRYNLFAVTHHVAQDRLGVAAQDRKFPTTGQLCVGKVQWKIRQHDPSQPGIFDSDNKSTLI